MRSLIFPAIALTGALVAVVPAIDLAAAPSNRPRDIKVVVDFSTNSTNKIQGDGSLYTDGVDGVNAYISGSNNGALIFSTGAQNSAVRKLRFFFDNCVSTGCSAPWPDLAPEADLDERAGLLANAWAVPGGLTAMQIGGAELSAWVKFDIPRDSDPAYYNVCFDARTTTGPCGTPGGTGTDARILRDTAGQWTIWANGTGDKADLIRDSQTRKTRTFTTLGTYSMPFSFTVTCVNSSDCP